MVVVESLMALLICGFAFVASISSENKIRSMQDLTTAILGRKYGQHFAHHLTDAVHGSQESVDAEHRSFPIKRLPFLACSKFTDSQLLIQELQMKAIPYHRIAKSHSSNHYCIKADIHKIDRDYLEQSSTIDFTVLQPFVPLMKFDLSLLQLHSRYFDPLTSHLAYHPIMQDVATGQKVGLSLVFTHDTTLEDQQQFLQSLYSNLQSTPITPELLSRHIGQSSRSSRANTDDTAVLERHLFTRPHAHKQQLNNHHQPSKFITAGTEAISTLSGSLHDVCHLSTPTMESRLVHRGIFITLSTQLHILGHESQLLSTQAKYAFCMYNIAKIIAEDAKIMKIGLAKPLQTQNNLARLILQSGSNSPSIGEVFTKVGLNGSSGVVLGVSDTGLDENSCFFIDSIHGKVPRSDIDHPTSDLKYRKVIQYVNYSGSSGDYSNGHGTHVSGTLSGYCSDSSSNMNSYHGMASQSKLAFFDIGMNDQDQSLIVPYNLGSDLFHTAYSAGAKIHSNSWGGGYFYDAYCIAADEYVYKTQDFMPFFAMGNNGAQGRETALSPGLSKNVISVGATQTGHYSSQNIDYIAFFSSMGPTLDGRIKPDILGPGFSLTSSMATSENNPSTTCSVSTKAGTSMATPAVASTAGLIQDYFQHAAFWKQYCNPTYRLCQRGSFTPNAALMKALVLHSGQNVSYYDGRASNFGFVELGQTPDSYQGYGRMRLDKLLPLTSSQPLYVDDMHVLTSYTEITYRIEIPNEIEEIKNKEIKVTLAWIDPPTSYFASQLLINDLDLLIEDPNGRVLYGNAPLYAFGTHRDEVNPHEQVIIPAHLVIPGNYTVRIQAKYFDIAQYATQSFAVVITANGVITEPTMSKAGTAQLDSATFQKCSAYHTTNMLQLGIALWARVTSRGWSDTDFYSISKLNITTLQVDSVVVSEETMTDKLALQVEEICLTEGMYSITMNLSPSAVSGSQLSLPDCEHDLLLTPLQPTAEVVILSSNTANSSLYRALVHQYSGMQSGSTVSTTGSINGEAICIPVLSAFQDHYLLPVNLTEYSGGSGWSGSYYTLFKLPFITGKESESVVMSGTMDWGFEQVKHLTIPLQTPSDPSEEVCYALQLSYSSKLSEEEYPEIYFAPSCPYAINMTVTMTQFCILQNGRSLSTIMHFYHQPGLSDDLGQLPGGAAMYREYAEVVSLGSGAILLGSCTVDLKRSKGMIVSNGVLDGIVDDSTDDSVDDGAGSGEFYYDDYYYSVTHPNTTTPTTTSLTYNNYNLSCLSSCPNYPGNDTMHTDLDTACMFLASLFKACDSYALSAGLCIPPHDCMQTCTVAMTCYLGAGSANSCPVASSQGRWRGNSDASRVLSEQCFNSFAAAETETASTNDDALSGGGSLSGAAKGLIIAVVVIIIMIVVCLLCSSYYKTQQPNSSTMPLAGSPTRSDGPSNTSSTATNTASNIVERGKNLFQKKFRRPGSSSKASSQQYEMVPVDGEVRNPFTIRNDDDEEEENVEDDYEAERGDEDEEMGHGGEVEDVSTHSNRAFELGDEDDGDLRL